MVQLSTSVGRVYCKNLFYVLVVQWATKQGSDLKGHKQDIEWSSGLLLGAVHIVKII